MNKKHGLRTLMSYGKYNGEYLSDVIDCALHYIHWMTENFEWFELDEAAREYLEEKLEEKINR